MMKVLITVKNLIDESTFDYFKHQKIEIIEIKKNEISTLQDSENCKDVNVIVGGSELSNLNIERLPELKLIQTISAGFDYLDKDKIIERGVKLANASGIYSIPIAEWVVGQILYSYKNFDHFKKLQSLHKWEPIYNLSELNGRKVLVFGTGSIGKEICKRLNAFDCIVDGVNSDGRLIANFAKTYSLRSSVKVINNYDILIFALPSNAKTKNFINVETLKNISEKCILINVGRGDLINENELLSFLENKKEVLIFMDVLNQEPLPKDSILWDHPQVFITPHTSYSSTNNNDRLKELILNNILKMHKKDKIINEIK